jgi:hypothetical protein
LRDQRNHREAVSRLVNWAKDNDYLPADHPGVPRTGSRVRIPPKRVEVFDHGQRELLIAHARPVELPTCTSSRLRNDQVEGMRVGFMGGLQLENGQADSLCRFGQETCIAVG